MRQKRHSTRLFTAALAALLVDSLVGASGFVFCRAANGHRAIELEHSAAGCPTLASSEGSTGPAMQPQGECIDVSSAGTGPMATPSFDAERVPTPPMTFAIPAQEPTLRIGMRFPGPADARAGPRNLAPHLRSTVLLV